jgi:hypothetical protein
MAVGDAGQFPVGFARRAAFETRDRMIDRQLGNDDAAVQQISEIDAKGQPIDLAQMRVGRKTGGVRDDDAVERHQWRARQLHRQMIDRHRAPERRRETRLHQRPEPVPVEQQGSND